MALKQGKKESCSIILLGESTVGKTSLVNRFIQNKFQKCFLTTLGLDSIIKPTTLKSGQEVILKIYDTAGQERYRTITHNYYQKSDGILLVYSIENKQSFEKITEWLKEIKDNAREEVIVFLIGNKCDLDKNGRNVSKKEGELLAEKYNIPFYESSAKLDINVKDIFEKLAEIVVEQKVNGTIGEMLTQNTMQKEEKKCC